MKCKFWVLASRCKELHDLSYIIKEIFELHIIILDPLITKENYYRRKSFHSTILQEISKPYYMF